MAPRSAQEDRTFTVLEPLHLGDDIVLPQGTYQGRLQWTEFQQVSGPPRVVSKRYVLSLSGKQVRDFGGKLGRTQKLREIDVSKLVANGLIAV